MVTITFRLAWEAGACASSYRRFAKHVGGVRKYGKDTPIPLTEIADFLGLKDALWCLSLTQAPEETQKLARLLAADFAEHVLPLFEKEHPNDNRPRIAIETARAFAEGKISAAARSAAKSAAWIAAGAAAWTAAGAAARAAAWAAASDAAWTAAWATAWIATGAAAGAAAKAAAWAAAGAAASDGAWTAAWAAEQEWQLQRFKEVIGS